MTLRSRVLFVVIGSAVLTGVLAAQPAPPPPPAQPPKTDWSVPARIKIDVDRTIGEVHPHLFGNFADHLGRMIYGGIYEEGSPLSDKEGVRLDTLEAVKGLNVSILRWPGGKASDPPSCGSRGRPPLDRWRACSARSLLCSVPGGIT